MYRILLYLFLIVHFHVLIFSRCQGGVADTFRSIPRDRLIYTTGIFYNDHLQKSDSLYTFRMMDTLSSIARERNEPALETYIIFLKGRYCYDKYYRKDSLPLRYFNAALARKACPEPVATEALFYKGIWYYAPARNYPLAFEYMLQADAKARKIGYENLPSGGFLLLRLAIAHLHFKEPATAIRHLQDALRVPGNNRQNNINLYNTLGLAYRVLQYYDSAAFYFHKALDIATTSGDTGWIGSISGNIGEIYFQQAKYDTAIRLLDKDFLLSMRGKDYGSAGNAAVLLARIYLGQDDIKRAKQILDTCRTMLPRAMAAEWKPDYYECLVMYHKKQEDYKATARYMDSFIVYSNYRAQQKQRDILERTRNKIDTETHLANIRLLESEKNRQMLIRNTVVIILIMALVIVFQILRKSRMRRIKDRQIFEMEQQRQEKELQTAGALLDSYVESLKQKNQMIDRFSREIEQLQHMTGTSPALAEKEEILKRLQMSTILTEDDWINFKQLFTSVHTDFFIRLNEKFPNLTQAEIRLLTLSKLGLSVNEKANMLGIAPISVRRTKQRLFKKMGISEHDILSEI